MAYLYIDESGDLGFSGKSSNFFIVACAKINNPKANNLFNRIPKEVRQRTISKKSNKISELKFSNSKELIREMFLKRVCTLDVEIYSLVINKKEMPIELRNDFPALYNHLLMNLLSLSLANTSPNEKVSIFIDRSMSKAQIKVFEEFMRCKLFKQDIFPEPMIIHENSKNNPGLQVIDFICGSFGYKYNSRKTKVNDNHYVDLIKDKLKSEQVIDAKKCI